MAVRFQGKSGMGAPRILRLQRYGDGRVSLWIRTPEEEATDPTGQGSPQQQIVFKPGDLPLELERAITRTLEDW